MRAITLLCSWAILLVLFSTRSFAANEARIQRLLDNGKAETAWNACKRQLDAAKPFEPILASACSEAHLQALDIQYNQAIPIATLNAHWRQWKDTPAARKARKRVHLLAYKEAQLVGTSQAMLNFRNQFLDATFLDDVFKEEQRLAMEETLATTKETPASALRLWESLAGRYPAHPQMQAIQQYWLDCIRLESSPMGALVVYRN
ncbi:MAG: hypothetical protein ACPGTU_16305, partial [Myxococcota bacterium]